MRKDLINVDSYKAFATTPLLPCAGCDIVAFGC